ncbi:hypothetical protein Poly51_26090 [Rubripirellula tenax]|uniref:Flippase-like domain-containing protein n=1 Tax=Rubripirellula tenax TaxID=2528015 RepID=A0A5C6F6W5_9BACT|nr:lysylphosphatidylglycerol synthase domain-containing protein [Rubripirellula tenax]TWU56692.1 hypothetical protein Poly51_26090 [Rubripirellula tenax]
MLNESNATDESEDRSSTPHAGAPVWKRAAQVVIAGIVVVGLVLAGRSSVQNWRLQTTKIEAEIASLEKAISEQPDDAAGRSMSDRVATLKTSLPSFANIRWGRVAASAVIYALGLLPSAMLLHRAVTSLGGRPKWSTAIVAQTLGHVGKYVPGKAMVIVLRGGVLARDGVQPLTATIGVFLETFLMMAVGAVVAAVATVNLELPRWISITAIVTAVLAGLPTLPPILRRVAIRVTRVSPQSSDRNIGWSLFASGWAWSLLSWLLIGASFTVLITAIPSADPLPQITSLYPIATAAISLAMVVGFASLLPGGAGVRELVLTSVLGVAIGPVHSLLVAVAARIVFMVVEAGLAAACWIWLKSHPAE